MHCRYCVYKSLGILKPSISFLYWRKISVSFNSGNVCLYSRQWLEKVESVFCNLYDRACSKNLVTTALSYVYARGV